MSVVQQGVWRAHQLEPDDPRYTVAATLTVRGGPDPELFAEALRVVFRAADSLHVRVEEDGDGPWLVPVDPARWSPDVVDLSDETDPAEATRSFVAADLARPFDPETGPPFAETLVVAGTGTVTWYHRAHHLVLDATGFELLREGTEAVYDALLTGRPLPPTAFPDAARLSEADIRYRRSRDHDRDRRYWTSRFADRPRAVGVTAGAGRAAGRPPRASTALPPSWRNAAGSDLRAGPALFVAATAAYLHRLTGAEDVVLRLPMTGRLDPAAAAVPGMAATVVPLRLTVGPDTSFRELESTAATEILRATRHQRYGLEELRRELGVVHSGRLQGGAMLNILPFNPAPSFGPHPAELEALANGPVEDLTISVRPTADGGFTLDVDLPPIGFTDEDVAAHRTRLVGLLAQLTTHPDLPLAEADRPPPDLPDPLAETPLPAGGPSTVLSVFAATARRLPGQIAVRDARTSLTYSALDTASRRLAASLLDQRLDPEDVVAVVLPRTVSWCVALLAVLRAGGTALSLPAEDDPDQLREAIQELGARHLLTTEELLPGVERTTSVLRLAHDGAPTPPHVHTRPSSAPARQAALDAPRIPPRRAAYLIRTSGSTGRPKGVVVEHRSLAALAERHHVALGAGEPGRRHRVAHTAPVSFDAALDPLVFMMVGHELVMVDDATRRDPDRLVDLLRGRRCDVLSTTPSYFRQLLAAGVLDEPDLALVLLGGEAVDQALWTRLRATPGVRAWNLYGPSECTVDAMVADTSDSALVTLGGTVPGSHGYVLDGRLRRLGPGSTGELYLAGACLARGYLGRAGLTAERFVADPWGAPGDRMYRTGDLVSWTPSGVLSFLGRADDQVKIRGARVELGAVERTLLRHPSVREAAATTRPDAQGDAALVAFVVLETPGGSSSGGTGEASTPPTAAELRTWLTRTLPEHHVPSRLVPLSALPTTSRGKLDRNALAEIPLEQQERPVEPTSELEAVLCGLFADALSLPAVGVHDDFFLLGGHSLLANRLLRGIRRRLGVRCTMRAVFDTPTVAGLLGRPEFQDAR
ncbi:amino acid adenylation domain-containing protein [Actinoalloteichus caeruleus]|uniref:amino acid adenylation domain-containing protein n=1 Tax=Actinoalloteichus cyanogriseus TaxID=2893586 RepID=UPI003BB8577E